MHLGVVIREVAIEFVRACHSDRELDTLAIQTIGVDSVSSISLSHCRAFQVVAPLKVSAWGSHLKTDAFVR